MSTPADELAPSPEAEQALQAISKLTERDRQWIFEQIEARETVDSSDLSPEWRDTLERRVRSLQDGSAELHDLADVEREAERLLEE